jgi:hypothetical protein
MNHDSIAAVMGRLDGMLDLFDAIGRHGHAVYKTYPPLLRLEHSKRTQANCIYDHIAEEASRRFDGMQHVKAIEIRQLKLWLIGDHTAIRWKKMDEDGKTRNYPTKQARFFDRNLPLLGLPPEPTRITVGYFLNPTATDVGRIQIARPNGRLVDWCAAIVPKEAREQQEGRKWEDVTRQGRWPT